jgi:hypothetical protein
MERLHVEVVLMLLAQVELHMSAQRPGVAQRYWTEPAYARPLLAAQPSLLLA